jgi:hypothetical protein
VGRWPPYSRLDLRFDQVFNVPATISELVIRMPGDGCRPRLGMSVRFTEGRDVAMIQPGSTSPDEA